MDEAGTSSELRLRLQEPNEVLKDNRFIERYLLLTIAASGQMIVKAAEHFGAQIVEISPTDFITAEE